MPIANLPTIERIDCHIPVHVPISDFEIDTVFAFSFQHMCVASFTSKDGLMACIFIHRLWLP